MVSAVAGSSPSVELACRVDLQHCGEVYYITWTRQQSAQSAWQRVYLFAGANDSKPLAELAGRAHFSLPEPLEAPATTKRQSTRDRRLVGEEPETPTVMSDGRERLARLVIDEPQLADDALYKCDVTYVQGKCPSITTTRLKMLGLPTRAVLVKLDAADSWPLELSSQSVITQQAGGQSPKLGPIAEGSQLSVACVVFGGRPNARLSWRRHDALGNSANLQASASYAHNASSRPADETAAQQMLQLARALNLAGAQATPSVEFVRLDMSKSLDASDLGAKFECHVEHDAMDARTDDSLDAHFALDLDGKWTDYLISASNWHATQVRTTRN